MHRAEIAAENGAAREQEGIGVLLISRRVIAVGKEIALPLAAGKPILIQGSDREHIGNVNLLDKFARFLD
jgi:hypothetical protein